MVRAWVIGLSGWMVISGAWCQNILWKNAVLIPLSGRLTENGKSPERFRLLHDLEYTTGFNNFLGINRPAGRNILQVNLLQNFRYHSRLVIPLRLNITNTFVHNLGVLVISDSLARIDIDDNTLDTRIEYQITPAINLTFDSRLTTRLFNGYDYLPGLSGKTVRVMNSSFMTPLLWTFSGGIGMTVPRFLSFSFGLSAARFTYIRDRSVFETPGRETYYGVENEHRHHFEYGVSMHLLIDKKISGQAHWNCDLLIFKNYKRTPDLTLKNQFGVRLTRYLKTLLETRIIYEESVSPKVQVENLLSLGFYFHL